MWKRNDGGDAGKSEGCGRDHDEAPQCLVLAKNRPPAKHAAAIKRNSKDLREAIMQPQRVQNAGKHEGQNQEESTVEWIVHRL